MGRYAKWQPRPLKEIAIVDKETIDEIAAQIPPSGVTISQVKADTDIADALTKKHSIQDLSVKVDKVTGYSIVPDTEITKLSGLNKITFSSTPPGNPQPNEIWIQTT